METKKLPREITIVLPLADNDGVDLSEEIEMVKAGVLGISSGYSVMQQSGAWQEDDVVYDDNSLRLVTVVEQDEQVQALRELAIAACGLMRQQAIFFQERVVKVEFLRAA
jgi:hypothetical protein